MRRQVIFWHWLAAVVLVGILASCCMRTKAPTTPTRDAQTQAASDTIRAGDRLRVSVFELVTPGLTWSDERVVADDGTIDLPNLGKIKVAGLTAAQVETKIRTICTDMASRIIGPGPSSDPGPAITVKRVP